MDQAPFQPVEVGGAGEEFGCSDRYAWETGSKGEPSLGEQSGDWGERFSHLHIVHTDLNSVPAFRLPELLIWPGPSFSRCPADAASCSVSRMSG